MQKVSDSVPCAAIRAGQVGYRLGSSTSLHGYRKPRSANLALETVYAFPPINNSVENNWIVMK